MNRIGNAPDQFHLGDDVLVKGPIWKKGKPKSSVWQYIAKIVGVKEGKYLYQLKWDTHGPNMDDKPGLIAKRWYHQRYLKALPLNINTSDFEFLRTIPDNEYYVEKILGYRETGNTREFLVNWSGFPASASTWEPRYLLICHDFFVQA